MYFVMKSYTQQQQLMLCCAVPCPPNHGDDRIQFSQSVASHKNGIQQYNARTRSGEEEEERNIEIVHIEKNALFKLSSKAIETGLVVVLVADRKQGTLLSPRMRNCIFLESHHP